MPDLRCYAWLIWYLHIYFTWVNFKILCLSKYLLLYTFLLSYMRCLFTAHVECVLFCVCKPAIWSFPMQFWPRHLVCSGKFVGVNLKRVWAPGNWKLTDKTPTEIWLEELMITTTKSGIKLGLKKREMVENISSREVNHELSLFNKGLSFCKCDLGKINCWGIFKFHFPYSSYHCKLMFLFLTMCNQLHCKVCLV